MKDLDRTKRESVYYPTLTNDKQEFIRNFGIIAHIDAGKTTTTERMLYYAGALPQPGEVHDGTTVMDYMPQERQRGITIRSAAISFNWNDFQYNLIDTPGHIDFTAEVERSLRVLDGAVAIFDGVSGVETQSETVWFQANKFNIPRIAFVNKMDRQGASLEYTIGSMRDRLNIVPLVLQYPLGEQESFQGIIDLIDLKIITWTDKLGNIVNIEPVSKDHILYSKILKSREDLLENIANLDDEFAEIYLQGNEIQSNIVKLAIKRTLNRNPLNVCPVLVGSALKNKGVQNLLDAVHQFLPSPIERPPVRDSQNQEIVRQLNSKEKLCAYTYKIVNDQELGNLAYTRIYSGTIETKTNIFNSTIQQQERINNIYRVRANKYIPIPEVQAGDIVAIQGLRNSLSGCTLNSPTDPPFVLSQLEMPPCVFFAQLEYESMKDKVKLDSALDILQQEDSSLKITQDEAGQIVIGGLGELHLEIVQQRLKEDFNLKTTLKKMQVEYKESIQEEYVENFTYNETVNNRPLWFNLKIKLVPLDLEEMNQNEIVFDFQRPQEFDIYYKEFKQRLQKKKVNIDQKLEEKFNQELAHLRFIRNPCIETEIGVIEDSFGEEKVFSIQSLPFSLLYEVECQLKAALSRGPLLSYPIVGVRACILGGQYTAQRTTEIAVGRCVQKLVLQTLNSAEPIIMEPVMNIDISTPNTVLQTIINDLIAIRRGRVKQVDEDKSRFGKIQSNRTLIQGSIPLQETIGYSTYIRSVSQGEANFVMSFHKYEFVGGVKQNQILQGDF